MGYVVRGKKILRLLVKTSGREERWLTSREDQRYGPGACVRDLPMVEDDDIYVRMYMYT